MNTNNNHYFSQVVLTTTTSIIFTNLGRCGSRLCTEVFTTDDKFECVQYEMDGGKYVLECNATLCAKFVHCIFSIKVYGYKGEYWYSKA